jgi:Niemann-Pick C1 protein
MKPPFTIRCHAEGEADWRTLVHEPGRCATYGICGHRADGDPLSCANNTAAQPLAGPSLAKLQAVCPQLATDVGAAGGTSYCCTEEQLDQLQKQIQVASIFLVGCPACNHNFKHFFCLLTCSPDQAAFANVTAAQTANDTGASNAVAEMDYYVAAAFGERFYNSCKDVVYPVMNQKAMTFVGGGAKDYQEWFDFIGLLKDKRFPPVGSPFQMNFPPGPPPGGHAAGSRSGCLGRVL